MNPILSNVQPFSLPSDPGVSWANRDSDTPLPGVMRGGQDRYLAEIYAIRKNKATAPRPYFAGGNKTVNM